MYKQMGMSQEVCAQQLLLLDTAPNVETPLYWLIFAGYVSQLTKLSTIAECKHVLSALNGLLKIELRNHLKTYIYTWLFDAT